MAAKGQEVAATQEKSLLNQDGTVTKLMEWATLEINTPEEMLEAFLDAGIEVSGGQELTGGYRVIGKDEKAEFCHKMYNVRIGLPQWTFIPGDFGEFVTMHLITHVGKYILTDGSKGGMYSQLRRLTDERESKDPASAEKRTSTAGAMAHRGIKPNDIYYYDKLTDRAIPARNLNLTNRDGSPNLDFVPEDRRVKAEQSWSFVWG